jgi:hypothetical protein
MSVANFNFTFLAQHIPGVQNKIADALSRFHWQEFKQLAPNAKPSPIQIPQQFLEELTSRA